MKNDILHQLSVLFNFSSSGGSFPTILEICKVTPIYKKDSKTSQIIALFPYYLTLIESFKRYYMAVHVNFLKIANSFIIYSLNFDINTQLHML